jgi:uncharacterized protein DUF6010
LPELRNHDQGGEDPDWVGRGRYSALSPRCARDRLHQSTFGVVEFGPPQQPIVAREPEAVARARELEVVLRGDQELLYPAPALTLPVVYLALGSYRFIGIAWIMHSAWDVVHHFWGNPIWPFMRTSSFGCMIFDMVIGIWCLAGAPSLLTLDVMDLRRPRTASRC